MATMSRSVQLVLVCEDSQQEAFARRFLEKAGWSTRRLRVEKAPRGRGSAVQFIRERFPIELSAYRSNRNRVAQWLVVILDGDNQGVARRLNELNTVCQAQSMKPREKDDHVAIIVPTWRIETWLAYLDGENVDESKSDYPRLDRPRDCQRHVDRLHAMCQQGALRQPVPASLEAACEELRARMPS
jgi:hypothetical protein